MSDWLVVGSGMIASGIMRYVPHAVQMRRPDHDIRTIDTVPGTSGGVAVVCGAVTGIRQCELFPGWSRNVNVRHTLRVARLLHERGWKVVMMSSQAAVKPTTEYGWQKAAVEKAWEFGPILRLPKIVHRDQALICSWKYELSRGRLIFPFVDASIQPITVPDAVEAIRAAAAQARGIVEAPGYVTTWFHVAHQLAKACGYDTELVRRGHGGFTHPLMNGTILRGMGWQPPTIEHVIDALI